MSAPVWWQADEMAVMEGALGAASAGQPALLVVEGAAGQGKSTLLREVEGRARGAGFEVLSAEPRHERTSEPFSLLRALGIDHDEVDRTADPFQAAQALRDLIDASAADGPVLLAVDDVQWVDRDSLEALTWLLRRAEGERMLVLLATRPPAPQVASAWRRLQEVAGQRVDVQRIHLRGLSRELTGRLVRAEAPDADAVLIERLWHHTEGNPLYLHLLLREYDATVLREMDELPAPAELTRSVTARLERLDPDAVTLVRAVAVLGDDWTPLVRAAEVAVLRHPGEAVAVLEADELLRRLGSGAQARVRIAHAVLRAAVYQDTPFAQRAELHGRAASTSASPLEALEHRFAAVDGYDEALAELLVSAADRCHADGRHRESARLLGRAAEITGDPRVRDARRLDALFELGLAHDADELGFRLAEHAGGADPCRLALAQAMQLVLRRHWVRARDVLDDVPPNVLLGADSVVRYRLLTVRAWAGAVTGRPAEEVLADLEDARQNDGPDDALAPYAVLARRQAEMQSLAEDRVADAIRALPRFEPHQHLTGPELYMLGWVGGLHSAVGDHRHAIPYLLRFGEALRSGPRDLSEGGYGAMLGYAQWMTGDWDAAKVTIRLALDSRLGPVHPIVAAVAPLAHLAAGDVAAAQVAARESRSGLLLAPWPLAVQVALVSEVVVRHHQNDPEARRRLLEEFAGELDVVRSLNTEGWLSPLTRLHLGLAYLWAERLDEAERIAARLTTRSLGLPWTDGASAWLSGLVALSRNDAAAAQERLRVAVPGLAALPLHRAHAASDLVEVSTRLGDSAAAAGAREVAITGYSRLGLSDYVRRLDPSPVGESSDDPLASLSGRERDVVALLERGLSYAQIARELYVSRSTVAFHLGNVYAKTNTSSRHELADLIRAYAPV